MSEIALLQLIHILLFVYWLGGDLGVFYSSFFVADDSLSPAQRKTAAAILIGLDQGPRICMPLIFVIGVQLASAMQLIVPASGLLPGLWLLAAIWVGMVMFLHLAHGHALSATVTRIDFMMRIVVIAAITLTAGASLIGKGPTMPDWIAVKLLVFATLVLCGLLIRIKFKPFMPAFVKLVSDGASDEVNQTIRSTLSATRPFVIAIWIGLLFNAAIGVHLVNF